jgi:hypothetical protein
MNTKEEGLPSANQERVFTGSGRGTSSSEIGTLNKESDIEKLANELEINNKTNATPRKLYPSTTTEPPAAKIK